MYIVEYIFLLPEPELSFSFVFQDHGTGALVISSLLDFLTFALCAPYSETTEGQQFDMLLEMVAANGRTLFKLFQVNAVPCQ